MHLYKYQTRPIVTTLRRFKFNLIYKFDNAYHSNAKNTSHQLRSIYQWTAGWRSWNWQNISQWTLWGSKYSFWGLMCTLINYILLWVSHIWFVANFLMQALWLRESTLKRVVFIFYTLLYKYSLFILNVLGQGKSEHSDILKYMIIIIGHSIFLFTLKTNV